MTNIVRRACRLFTQIDSFFKLSFCALILLVIGVRVLATVLLDRVPIVDRASAVEDTHEDHKVNTTNPVSVLPGHFHPGSVNLHCPAAVTSKDKKVLSRSNKCER